LAIALNLSLVLIAAAVLAALFSRRLVESPVWRATVTPLASIIGSGFLVSIPLLAGVIGNYALFGMAALIVYAYLVGGAIRFNILHGEPLYEAQADARGASSFAAAAERLSHIALAGAYFVSVAYYLSLLSIFLLKGIGVTNDLLARGLTTGFLAFIGLFGWLRGLNGLERLEEYAVGFKLAVIAAIVAALVVHNIHLEATGVWALRPLPARFDGETLRALLGFVIVVQGFETSRFLAGQYPPALRVRTMRNAQLISGAIYLLFFAAATVMFRTHFAGGEVAAIIDIVGAVAVVLPAMLTAAAVASQFSAAVADAIGGAGLLHTAFRRPFELRYFYPVIAGVAIALVWSGSVFDIIATASRAFAFYYFLQCAVAALVVFAAHGIDRRPLRAVWFGLLAAASLAAALFGIPSA
jgi:hypothetical protein